MMLIVIGQDSVTAPTIIRGLPVSMFTSAMTDERSTILGVLYVVCWWQGFIVTRLGAVNDPSKTLTKCNKFFITACVSTWNEVSHVYMTLKHVPVLIIYVIAWQLLIHIIYKRLQQENRKTQIFSLQHTNTKRKSRHKGVTPMFSPVKQKHEHC